MLQGRIDYQLKISKYYLCKSDNSNYAVYCATGRLPHMDRLGKKMEHLIPLDDDIFRFLMDAKEGNLKRKLVDISLFELIFAS